MKSLCKALLPILLTLCFLTSSALGETLYTHHVSVDPQWTGAYEPFAMEHPGVAFAFNDDFYYTTEEFLHALNTSSPKFDMFQMNTDAFDCQGIMAMGYCADLSESQVVQEALSRMHAPIREKLMADGMIYGIPHSITFSTFSWCQDAWDAAGLTEADVPTTYSQLLDFLENWIKRIEKQPEKDISVNNMFDETLYGPYSYTYYLLNILMDTYVTHCERAGVPVRFDVPVFRELLDRTKTVGEALYKAEPKKKGKMQLFDNGLSGYTLFGTQEGMSHVIPLRITEDQPLLIKALMDLYCVGADSERKELATAYVESALTHMDTHTEEYTRAYVFTDSQPLERADLESDIPEYLISPAWLADYKAYAHLLYFPGPGIYSMSTEESRQMRRLVESFSKGKISMEAFIQSADEIVRQWERW